MANIDSQINDRMNAFSGNPQALMQRYAQTQDLVDLLALQKMNNDRKAATAAVQGAMQPPAGTVKGQLEQQAMQGARNDILRSMAPGIQQQGVRTAQMRNRAAMGLPTQAAPNMARMAQGGIVGYQEGGMPKVGEKSKGPIPQMSAEENAQMLKYLEGLKKFDYYFKNPDKVSAEGRQALELERRMFEEQFSPAFKQKVNEMMYGPSKGMVMGGEVKRYDEGGLAALESDTSRFGIENEIELDPMVARAMDLQRNKNIGRAYLDPETGEPMSLGRRIGRLFQGSRGETYEDPNRLTPEELDAYPKPAEIRRALRNLPEEERLSPQDLDAMSLAEKQAFGAQKALDQRAPTEPTPEPSGITADMYDVRNMMAPTNKQKLGSMVGKPSAVFKDNMAEREEKGLDIDFRALREFLTSGAGQTSTAGALAAGARGLGAFQAAEQSRLDKIQQAANELQLKRDLAANDARMLSARLAAEYQGKMDDAAFEVAAKALEDTRDPLNQEFQTEAAAIRRQYSRQPVVMQTALDNLRDVYVQKAVQRARQAVGVAGAPAAAASVRDLGVEE